MNMYFHTNHVTILQIEAGITWKNILVLPENVSLAQLFEFPIQYFRNQWLLPSENEVALHVLPHDVTCKLQVCLFVVDMTDMLDLL